ncbi:MAG TPA: PAS domain S-box protein, partial [Candidatus Methanofastidiosa archaeon]|nr:PAS domain S-box protein [Candidatus Methanofastidiosa archaeon]
HYLQKGGDPRPQYAELLHKVHQTVRLNKAKHALWESEKRYRRLFQETPLGIINYDTHGTILDCNKRFVEIVGSSKKELLGLNMINDLVNKDVIEEIKKSLKSGKGYYEGLYTSMTAGKTTSLRAIFKGIKDTNGRIYAGLALIEDITERSKIEKDLRESERKYRTIIEKTPVGLLKFKMSPEGIFYPAFISNNIASFTGVSTSEAYEDINNLIEHIHPDHRDMIYNKMKHAEHNIGYDEFTIACNAKDGLRWLDVRVTPSREEDGTLVWDVVFMDITERKNAEEKLSSLATEYETVFTGTQDSMFLVEVVSDGFRYIRTNKSHQESTGFTLDDIMGKTPQELLGKRMGDVIASNYRRSIDTKGPVTYKETLDLPAGKKIWRTTLTPVFENGRARYIVGSSQDVTEHENALEALAQTADRQQVLLDNIDMQVWYMTDEHTYGMVNEAHAAFCCMRKEDLAYKDIREVCPKDISGFFQQSIEKVFSTGIRERGEVWVTNKSGEKRLLLMTKSPKANANSSVKYVICTAEDITEYREAEENAKASEMKYRSLVENLNDVVYILNEKAEVAYISPNIEA